MKDFRTDILSNYVYIQILSIFQVKMQQSRARLNRFLNRTSDGIRWKDQMKYLTCPLQIEANKGKFWSFEVFAILK